MADQSHLGILARGVEAWNAWRTTNVEVRPDLSGVNLSRMDLRGVIFYETDLRGANLSGANLSKASLFRANLFNAYLEGANLQEAALLEAYLEGANFSEANLLGTNLTGADFSGAILARANLTGANLFRTNLSRVYLYRANLSQATLLWSNLSGASLYEADLLGATLRECNLTGANLSEADLSAVFLQGSHLTGANLFGANLTGANLFETDLSEANLFESDLTRCTLVKTNLEGTMLTGCRIYGTSAWDLNLTGAEQKNLFISPEGQPDITADDLEVAQFIYLLLKNEKIRNVIDTMTSKAVLILGNFSAERKAILEEIRKQLRERNYLPILFDFEGSESLDFVETVTTVARLARFVIADITQPRAVPDELRAIVTGVSVPIQPFIMGSERPYATFPSLRTGRTSVLKLRRYEDTKHLVSSFEEEIVGPADAKFRELEMERAWALAEEV